jgi:hypothetical protein
MKYTIKHRFKRLRVYWRKWRRSIDNRMTIERKPITTYEGKAIRLWKILLKDEDTQMNYNTSGVRQIEKDNVLMMFQPAGNSEYLMTLFDVDDTRRSLYELRIPQKESEVVSDYFDTEMEKRMKKAENNKRSIIETDLDKLLEKEEKLLTDRKNK